MSDDSNLNNHGKQDTNISESRRLKVVGGSDFEAEFDNSPTKVQNNYIKPPQTEEEVGTISREELDARLAANKAEMESIASSIRTDMALSRESVNVQFASLNAAISSLSSKIDGKMDSAAGDIKAINGRFEGIQGQITGVNNAISGVQSGISIRLAIFSVIIAVIVAIPGLVSALKSDHAPLQQPSTLQAPPQNTQPTDNKKITPQH